MRIGLDLRMLDGGSGISRYIFELTTRILELDKTNEYVLFFRDEKQTVSYQQYRKKMVVTGIPHYSFGEQMKLPGFLNRERLDLMHFPHFNAPIFYRKPFVATIHDLTHTKFPGKKKSHFLHRLAYNLVLKNTVGTAKKIIAVSGATKKELAEHFHLPPEKITVIYEGANERYRMMDKNEARVLVSKKFGISKPFVLYVGVWRRYKNLPNLARVFDELCARGHDLNLVLAGESDPFYPEIREQIFSIQQKNRIIAPGRVKDEDLNLLYNAATLFVLPSLAEGFGLTAIEAATCGAPIACSDIPTLREILGQAAEYFDPDNLENMADVMDNLLRKPERLEELANLGLKRAAVFDWKKSAEETIKIYEKTI